MTINFELLNNLADCQEANDREFVKLGVVELAQRYDWTPDEVQAVADFACAVHATALRHFTETLETAITDMFQTALREALR